MGTQTNTHTTCIAHMDGKPISVGDFLIFYDRFSKMFQILLKVFLALTKIPFTTYAHIPEITKRCHAMPCHAIQNHITPNITHSFDLSLPLSLSASMRILYDSLMFCLLFLAYLQIKILLCLDGKGDTKSQRTQKHYFSSSCFRCSSKFFIFLFPSLNDANNN